MLTYAYELIVLYCFVTESGLYRPDTVLSSETEHMRL